MVPSMGHVVIFLVCTGGTEAVFDLLNSLFIANGNLSLFGGVHFYFGLDEFEILKMIPFVWVYVFGKLTEELWLV